MTAGWKKQKVMFLDVIHMSYDIEPTEFANKPTQSFTHSFNRSLTHSLIQSIYLFSLFDSTVSFVLEKKRLERERRLMRETEIEKHFDQD